MTRGERRAVLITAVVLTVLVVIGTAVWAVLESRSSSDPANKCVNLGVASSMGGNVEHACGKAAHDWCAAAQAQQDAHAQAVQASCRTAGILP
jgi:hypothetical protein